MYKFIKDLLKKKEPEKILLAFSAVPAMLDEREKSSRISLEHDTLLKRLPHWLPPPYFGSYSQ